MVPIYGILDTTQEDARYQRQNRRDQNLGPGQSGRSLGTIQLAKPIYGFAMSPKPRLFATTGRDNVVKVFNVKTGEEIRSWNLHIPLRLNHPFSSRNFAFTPEDRDWQRRTRRPAYLLDSQSHSWAPAQFRSRAGLRR